MISDSQLLFSDGQAIVDTAISDNVYNRYPAGNIQDADLNATVDWGTGAPLYMLFYTGPVDFASGGAGTLVITLESDSTSNLATPPTVHWTSVTYAVADLTAGTQFWAVIPPATGLQKWIGFRYTNGAGDFTAGTLSSMILIGQSTKGPQYASGLNHQ